MQTDNRFLPPGLGATLSGPIGTLPESPISDVAMSVFGDPDVASKEFVKFFDGGGTAGVKTEAGGGAVEDDAEVFGAGVFGVGGDARALGESSFGS